MTVQQLLQSFESFSEADQREAAAQILRRTLESESFPLTDEELVAAAEMLFAELDAREAGDVQP